MSRPILKYPAPRLRGRTVKIAKADSRIKLQGKFDDH